MMKKKKSTVMTMVNRTAVIRMMARKNWMEILKMVIRKMRTGLLMLGFVQTRTKFVLSLGQTKTDLCTRMAELAKMLVLEEEMDSAGQTKSMNE